jgi:hypothetical protein
MARYGGSWESDQDENRVAGDGHACAELGHQELRCPHVRCEDVQRPDVRLDVRFESVRFAGVRYAGIGFVVDVTFENVEGVRYEGVPFEDLGNLGREDLRDHDRHPAEAVGRACRYGQRERCPCSGAGAEPAHEGHAHPDARHQLCR